jgi:hypothetical protein
MGFVISGVFSAEECGDILRLGRFASPTQAHLRSTEDECLCTYEHLRISIRQWDVTMRLQELFKMFKRVQQVRFHEFKLQARKYL